MNAEIAKLIDELREPIIADAFERREITSGVMAERLIQERRRCAVILQAVFDPENQPSQYGTRLIEEK